MSFALKTITSSGLQMAAQDSLRFEHFFQPTDAFPSFKWEKDSFTSKLQKKLSFSSRKENNSNKFTIYTKLLL